MCVNMHKPPTGFNHVSDAEPGIQLTEVAAMKVLSDKFPTMMHHDFVFKRMARKKWKQRSSSVLKDSCVPASYSHQCSSTIHKKEGKDLGIKPYCRWRWIKNQIAWFTAESFHCWNLSSCACGHRIPRSYKVGKGIATFQDVKWAPNLMTFHEILIHSIGILTIPYYNPNIQQTTRVLVIVQVNEILKDGEIHWAPSGHWPVPWKTQHRQRRVKQYPWNFPDQQNVPKLRKKIASRCETPKQVKLFDLTSNFW